MNNETTSQPPQKHIHSKRSWGNKDDKTSLFTSVLCSRRILTFKGVLCARVCSQKNNATSPPGFLFLCCYGLVKLDQLRCVSFLTVCQVIVCRILMKVIVFIDIPQLVCTLWWSKRWKDGYPAKGQPQVRQVLCQVWQYIRIPDVPAWAL